MMGRECFRRSLLVLLLAQGTGALAEVVRVRSGEHSGFSRLVLDLPKGTEWSFGRGTEGYELRVEDPAPVFDIGGVFAKIPRTRLAGVALRDAGAGLLLTVGPDTYAQASETSDGGVIIDIADGPAPIGSPFESPLDPPPVDLAEDRKASRATGIGGQAATLGFRPGPNEGASLPIYWRDVPGAGVTTSTTPVATETPVPAAPDTPAVLPPVISPPPPEPPPVPAPEMLALEEALRLQLSRAAAQGLADLPEPGPDRSVGPKKPAAAGNQPSRRAREAQGNGQTGTGRIAYHAETGMDRDAPANPNAHPLTSEGAPCLAEDALDLRNWGTDERPTDQLARARQGLVGEFDRPDGEAVRRLSRLYLYFGMGAEARQTLAGFNLTADDTGLITDLAQVMDDLPVRSESPLHDMRDCDTPVALWAFLAAPDGLRKHEVEIPPIVRAFSGLPPHLRQLLGRRVSDRLIAMGASAAARAVRNAVARQAEATNRELGMIDAALALDEGGQTGPDLDRLAVGNDDVALRAAMLSLQTRLTKGDPISPEQSEAIAALAFEHRRTKEGRALAALEIATRAATGDFDTAFLRYQEERDAQPDADLQRTLDDLFTTLAEQADAESFLRLFFEKAALGRSLGIEARLQVARRLSDLGFAEEVRELLGYGSAAATDEGALLLARAALDLSDPGAALGLMVGREGTAATAMRAEALAAQGDFSKAAQEFAAAGAPDRAADAAWSGGDLAGAAALSERHAKRLQLLSRPLTTPLNDGRPSLSEGRDSVAESAEFRAALAELLTEPAAKPSSAADAGPASPEAQQN